MTLSPFEMLFYAQCLKIFLPFVDLEGSSIQYSLPEPANALTPYYIAVHFNITIALFPFLMLPSMLHVPTISPAASLPP